MRNNVATRIGVALASVGVLAGFGTFSTAAQPLPKGECRLANAVISELFTKYSGKLSEQFVSSVKSFVAKDCDMGTDFKMVEGTQDAAAFGELRVRLVAYRMRR